MTTAPATAAPAEANRRGQQVAQLVQRHGALIVLAVLLAVGGLAFDTFLTAYNLGNLAVQASFLAVIALGMTMVIITGGIDLSVGSVYALSGVLAAYGAREWGLLGAFALPLAVSAAIGLAHGLLVGKAKMAAFIVTLGGLLFARGLLQFLTAEGSQTYLVPQTETAFLELGQGRILGLGIPVLIVLVLYLLGGLVLQRTRFGMRLFAIGGSEDASSLMGLPVARTKVSVYVISAVLAGLAGILSAAQLGSGVTVIGVGLELDAIAAVVIGGTLLVGGAGSVGGTLAGVALLFVIRDVINQVGGFDSSMQLVVSGGFLVVVVVLQTLLSRAKRR
ncbi:ABC transporter permease [Crossiella cryophila]|uniref:Ribose transport system permease protein n=1 Tax=Crossiella cryophila TaxID=43355 RepID=A0A7W7CBX9_9PSEU|nr:ABC transporter permease [Crossiella cryophila]MBB4677071.1 ribose transport system permease protein [Crossiella cryophila]